MDWISNFFTRAKHYQVFVLFAVLYFANGVSSAFIGSTHTDLHFSAGLFWATFLAELSLYSYLLWLWAIGTAADFNVRPELRLDWRAFQVTIAFPALYLPFAIAGMLWLGEDGFAVLIAGNLFAAICVFYANYFAARSLAMAGRRKSVEFGQYAQPLLQLLFFPIGVWIIQPRVNRMYTDLQRRSMSA